MMDRYIMRFGRLALPVINDRPDYKFEIGKGIVLKEGTDVTIYRNRTLRKFCAGSSRNA